MGVLILIYGFTQGVFPELPDLSKLNAFDLSFFASHPKFAVFFVTLMPILLLTLFAVLSVRVRDFWANVRQGVTLLTQRRAYFWGAALPQAVAWLFRFASIWLMLVAFNIESTLDIVLTVIAVQTAASLIPLTPQGAGVQQALLVTALAGVATGASLAAYSVGQQTRGRDLQRGLRAGRARDRVPHDRLARIDGSGQGRAGGREGGGRRACLRRGSGGPPADDTVEFEPGGGSASQTTLEYDRDLPDEPRDY